MKPNLIQANCTNVVVDPKDHLAEKTGKFFVDRNYKVKVFDLVNMANCNSFNPFRYIDSENDLNRLLTTYFNNTKGKGTKSDPFWDESSMILVRAIASYLFDFYNPPQTLKEITEISRLPPDIREEIRLKWLEEEQDRRRERRERGRYPSFTKISRLIKLLSRQEGQVKSVLDIMFERYANEYGTENFTMRNWLDFQNYKDKTLDSVIAVTTAKFALFNIQSVIDLTERDTLEMELWGEEKFMVYLVIPDNDTTFAFLSALFFSTAFSFLSRQANTVHKGALPVHVRFTIDEFANVGKIPDFEILTSTVRSRNISVVPILQNISQLQGLYKDGEAWKTILGNCDTLLYLGGNDNDTFKFMSELMGKQTIDVTNASRSYAGTGGNSSVSYQKLGRELMTPDEVKRLPRDMCLVSIANMPVFKTKKYFPPKQHPNWKHLANEPTDSNWWHYTTKDLFSSNKATFDSAGHSIKVVA